MPLLTRPFLIAATLVLAAEATVRASAPSLPRPQFWPNTEQQTKADQMTALSRRGGARIVFVGSSLVDIAINPWEFGDGGGGRRPAYDGALGGESLWTLDVWTRGEVVPKLRPEVVVLGVSGRELNGRDPTLATRRQALRSRAFRRVSGNETTLDRLESRAESWSRLFRYRKVLRQPLTVAGRATRDSSFRVDRWGRLHAAVFQRPYLRGRQTAFQPSALRRWGLGPHWVAALRRTAGRLRAKGIDVVIVNMPLTEDWVGLLGRGRVDYERTTRAAAQVSSETGARFVDAGLWEREFFADAGHLNDRGAERFTRWMLDELGPSIGAQGASNPSEAQSPGEAP